MTRSAGSSSKPELCIDAHSDIAYVDAWKVGVTVYGVDAAEVNRPGEPEIRATFKLGEQEVRVWMDVATAARLSDGLTDALRSGRGRRQARGGGRPHASRGSSQRVAEDAALQRERVDHR